MVLSRHLFPLLALGAGASAFLPGQILITTTWHGGIVAGALVISTLLCVIPLSRNVMMLPALLLTALVLASPAGVSLAAGLPLLATGAALAMCAPVPESRAWWRALGLVGVLWIGWCLYGWFVVDIAPAESKAGFIRFFAPDWPTEVAWPKPSWPMGNPNPLAGLLVILLPLTVGFATLEAKSKPFRMTWAVLGLLMAALLYATGSRAGLVAPVLAGAGFLLCQPESRMSTKKRGMLVALIAFACVVGILGSDTYRAKFFGNASVAASDSVRGDYLESGWAMWRDQPGLGVGAGRVPASFGAYLSPQADHPGCFQLHCTPVHWAAELGIAGAALWLTLTMATGLGFWRCARAPQLPPMKAAAAMASLGYLLFSLLDYQAYIPVIAWSWGCAVGLLWRGTHLRPLTLRQTLIPGAVALGLAGLWAQRAAAESTSRLLMAEAASRHAAGDKPTALLTLARAMENTPTSPVYPAVAAGWIATMPTTNAEESRRNLAMADKFYERAQQLAPDFPYLGVMRGWLWVDADPQTAISHFRSVLMRSPKLPQAWHGLARAYGRLGKLDLATDCLALRAMILPEDLFSPDMRRGGFFGGAAPKVLTRFRALTQEYAQTFPEDRGGVARLTQVERQATAWAKSGECVERFIRENPAWSEDRLWRYLSGLDLTPLPDGTYPLRSRCIATAWLHSVANIEAKDGHAVTLLNQMRGIGAPFEGYRNLRSSERFAAFGVYFGDALGELAPTHEAQTDLLTMQLVCTPAPTPPHLAGAFFKAKIPAEPQPPAPK